MPKREDPEEGRRVPLVVAVLGPFAVPFYVAELVADVFPCIRRWARND